jgi:hypothetical protein
MTTIRLALAVAALGLLATAPEARADNPGELAGRLRLLATTQEALRAIR